MLFILFADRLILNQETGQFHVLFDLMSTTSLLHQSNAEKRRCVRFSTCNAHNRVISVILDNACRLSIVMTVAISECSCLFVQQELYNVYARSVVRLSVKRVWESVGKMFRQSTVIYYYHARRVVSSLSSYVTANHQARTNQSRSRKGSDWKNGVVEKSSGLATSSRIECDEERVGKMSGWNFFSQVAATLVRTRDFCRRRSSRLRQFPSRGIYRCFSKSGLGGFSFPPT